MGTVLFEVFALNDPEELGGQLANIGKIVTASECVTSYFGDEHLYFRHQRMEEDLALRPDWTAHTPAFNGIFSLEQQEEAGGCPFKNILDLLQL